MKIKNFLFFPSFFQEEAYTPSSFDDFDPSYIFLQKGSLLVKDKESISFDGFLDGSMQIFKIANASLTGTPLYVATLSAVILIRGKDKLLKDTHYSTSLNLILFPFNAYRQLIPENNILLCEFEKRLEKAIINSGGKLFSEADVAINKKGAISVLNEKSRWLTCDLTNPGVAEKSENKILITLNDLYNPARIKEVARSRTRYILSLLEFYCLYKFYQENPHKWIMVDGLIPPIKRLKASFGDIDAFYKAIIQGSIGFIKNPRKIPEKDVKEIMKLKQGEYRLYIGMGAESEIYEEGISEESEEPFLFAFMRFRSSPFIEEGPTGIIKLQIGDPNDKDREDINNIIYAVFRERLPFPSDKKRFFNESFPIEEAEKVAKSRLSSEDQIKGFMHSLIPIHPY